MSELLDIVLIVIINLFTLLKGEYKRYSSSQKMLNNIQYVLSVLSIFEIIISLSLPEVYPFTWCATFFRIFLLLINVRPIRRTWLRFLLVLSDSSSMILFICFYVLFFALLGFRIFRGSIEGVRYFPDYVTSCFNMLVLLTTANSPDIMLPAYEYSRVLAVFFVVYLLFGVFLIMNLLMALFYSNYKGRLTA